jgi:hypothetical protein
MRVRKGFPFARTVPQRCKTTVWGEVPGAPAGRMMGRKRQSPRAGSRPLARVGSVVDVTSGV